MKFIEHKITSSFALLSKTKPHRRKFATYWDYVKTVLATVAYSRSLMNRLPKIKLKVRLKKHESPISIRMATSDILIFDEVFLNDEYKSNEASSLKGSTIIDLGANIGLAARYMLEEFQPSRLITIEPDNENNHLLRENLKPRPDCQIKSIRAFATPKNGHAVLDTSGSQPCGYQRGAWVNGNREERKKDDVTSPTTHQIVDCITMESILENHQINRCDLLKCDIEGGEKELFGECEKWIGRVDRIIVETHMPYTSKQFLSDLRKANYDHDVVEITERSSYSIVKVRRKKLAQKSPSH